MIETDLEDTTWEDFFGTSPDLMPTVMGAFEEIVNDTNDDDEQKPIITVSPKRIHQSSNFANLSPGVQKILSNVPDQEISKNFSSEESLGNTKRFYSSFHRINRSDHCLSRHNENNHDIISTNVQKMLSNLPDTLLVAPAAAGLNNRQVKRNNSYLHDFVNHSNNGVVHQGGDDDNKICCIVFQNGGSDRLSDEEKCNNSTESDSYSATGPLGSYLHTSPQGIASRMPVGRLNIGKHLQVPNENGNMGTTSSTASSEVSRPVSLTSLGSCSSSGSSGHHQPGSAYLASAESLDSDPEPTGSQGSADSGIAEQPSISPEMRVLQEVLDTETVYVADLREVIQGYLEPWRADPECPLAQHIQHLFSNLEEIYRFNKSFLDNLQNAYYDPTKTANVFLENNSGFSVYNEYCTNYPRTMEILGKLTRDENMALLFREKQLLLGHALPLGSYLLKPVQRILKYHLLLSRLSKQCEPEHQVAVDLAFTTMSDIAFNINNMKRKHENAVRIQEIQSQLYGWPGPDLTALGELIAEGSFRVMGARGRRHVFLFAKVLLMAKNKQGGALAYKSHIMCSNLMLVEQVRNDALSFQVLPFDNPRLQCTLRAKSPQHKREWTLQIKRVMLENYSAIIPTHARQLVMQLGQDLQDNVEDITDKWSPLKQNSSTPHYLERRSRGRKALNSKRASSQERTFSSLGNWRRKSEPNMIPQYNTITMPKKISKLKKAKEITGSSKFYTDLSDSENCDAIDESTESLTAANQDPNQSSSKLNLTEGEEEENKVEGEETSVEKLVTDLLMGKEEYKKLVNRPRRILNSDNFGPSWLEERPKRINKSDSLPRSFLLNDQLEVSNKETETVVNGDDSLVEEDTEVVSEEQNDADLTSQIDDIEDHPDHKIYRKTTIRLSLLQRIRHMLNEEQKTRTYTIRKQGSKSMGEKIANPDYVDPQKLFPSRNVSQTNLTTPDFDPMGEREHLDMTISEHDVLNEIEKRLSNSTNECNDKIPAPDDTGQSSSHSNHLNSSQNSDSYYESLLDNSLTEEYVKDKNGRLIVKQDSFSNSDRGFGFNRTTAERKSIKRPSKAPPPIPVKPTHLSVKMTNTSEAISNSRKTIINSSCNRSCLSVSSVQEQNRTNSSWVKAMVDRFE